jgi:hypothetical protein
MGTYSLFSGFPISMLLPGVTNRPQQVNRTRNRLYSVRGFERQRLLEEIEQRCCLRGAN